jgi:hypothetical protein
MHNIVEILRYCQRVLSHPAHRAEQPMHITYYLLVAYYAGGPYGAAAFGCALVTILSMGNSDDSHHV